MNPNGPGPWFRIGKYILGGDFFINCAKEHNIADRNIDLTRAEFRKLILTCAKLYMDEELD